MSASIFDEFNDVSMLEKFRNASYDELLAFFPELKTVQSLQLRTFEYILGFKTSIQLYLDEESIRDLECKLYPEVFGGFTQWDILVSIGSRADDIFRTGKYRVNTPELQQLREERRKPLVASEFAFAEFVRGSVYKNGFRFLSIFGIIQYLQAIATPVSYHKDLSDKARMALRAAFTKCTDLLIEVNRQNTLYQQCTECGKEFKGKNQKATFCSESCKLRDWRRKRKQQ